MHLNGTIKNKKYTFNGKEPITIYKFCVPCLNLAALLNILPKIHDLKPIVDLKETLIQYNGIDLYVIGDSLIGDCYEMIIKLREMNLL